MLSKINYIQKAKLEKDDKVEKNLYGRGGRRKETEYKRHEEKGELKTGKGAGRVGQWWRGNMVEGECGGGGMWRRGEYGGGGEWKQGKMAHVS